MAGSQEADFAMMIELLREISSKLDRLAPVQNPPMLYESACKTCGIKFDGPMGYSCPRSDCPSGIRWSAST